MQNTEETLMKELTAATRVPLVFEEIETVLKLFSESNPLNNIIDLKNPTLRCSIT